MAKLKALPSLAIIKGFKGVIDYYMNYQACDRSIAGPGIPCARSWPRSPGHDRAPAVEAGWPAFAWAASNWNSIDPYVQEAYRQTAQETILTGRDLFTKSFITDYFREGQWLTPFVPPTIEPPEDQMIPSCWAYLNTVMNNLTSGDWYKVLFDAEIYDKNDDFDIVNSQFVAPKTGRYLIISNILFLTMVAAGQRWIRINQNAAEKVATREDNAGAGWQTLHLTAILDLILGDIVTVEVMQSSGSNTVDVAAYSNWTNIFASLMY